MLLPSNLRAGRLVVLALTLEPFLMSADPRSNLSAAHQLAAQLAEGGFYQLAGQLAALADLAADALDGRTAPHSPSMAPWPESIAGAMKALGGAAPADINSEHLVDDLRELPGGAAYLNTWSAGSRAQWGEGADPLSAADADALAAALMAGDDFEEV